MGSTTTRWGPSHQGLLPEGHTLLLRGPDQAAASFEGCRYVLSSACSYSPRTNPTRPVGTVRPNRRLFEAGRSSFRVTPSLMRIRGAARVGLEGCPPGGLPGNRPAIHLHFRAGAGGRRGWRAESADRFRHDRRAPRRGCTGTYADRRLAGWSGTCTGAVRQVSAGAPALCRRTAAPDLELQHPDVGHPIRSAAAPGTAAHG